MNDTINTLTDTQIVDRLAELPWGEEEDINGGDLVDLVGQLMAQRADPMKVTAEFFPKAWVRDNAIDVDPEGPREWDATAYAREQMEYLLTLLDRHPDGYEVLDNDDVFKGDPAAPEWVREWQGPFSIYLTIDGVSVPDKGKETDVSDTTPDDVVGTIHMQGNTLRFYQGAATASRVREEHKDVPWPNLQAEVAAFWFYCGAVAVDEHGAKTSEELSHFMLGANTRAPHLSETDQRVLSAVRDWKDSDFYNAFGFEREDNEEEDPES